MGQRGSRIRGAGIPGGNGGRNHAANEYYTVEAIEKSGGMATSEKAVAATIYEYAKLTTVPVRPSPPVSSTSALGKGGNPHG